MPDNHLQHRNSVEGVSKVEHGLNFSKALADVDSVASGCVVECRICNQEVALATSHQGYSVFHLSGVSK